MRSLELLLALEQGLILLVSFGGPAMAEENVLYAWALVEVHGCWLH